MLKAILNFFASLFGLGRKDSDPAGDPEPFENTGEAVGPQDGGDVPADSVTVVLPPDIFDMGNDDGDENAGGDTGNDTGNDTGAGGDDGDAGNDTGNNTGGGDDGGEDPPTPSRVPRYLWCLDNGHGKATAGKRSPEFEDGSQLFEYELVRDIVARMITALDKEGVKYFNVVPEVEGDIGLGTRCARANDKSSSLDKIYLSVHANANGRSGWNPAEGLETWYHRNSKKGVRIASAFQKHLMEHVEWKDRGIRCHTPVKKAFYVLRNTLMPAVLTENGFYTNKREASDLMKDEVRQKIADAHVAAILEVEDKGIEQIEIYHKNVTIDLS